VQPDPALPWQAAIATAAPSALCAAAPVAHHPLPAPPAAPQRACASATLPPVALCAELVEE
jgi:hypothetical protein